MSTYASVLQSELNIISPCLCTLFLVEPATLITTSIPSVTHSWIKNRLLSGALNFHSG